jgi:four helix bundle protein
MQRSRRNPSSETPNPTNELETRRPSYPFAHQRLDVHRVALEMASRSRNIADRVPRGYRSFADQLLRAAGQTVLLIGEGANRYTAGQKRQRYTEARGESGEVASAVELLASLRLAPQAEANEIMHLAGRVAAMLTRLIQRYS